MKINIASLLATVKKLHDINFMCLDIKPQNFFVDCSKNKSDSPKIKFGDVDGFLDLTEMSSKYDKQAMFLQLDSYGDPLYKSKKYCMHTPIFTVRAGEGVYLKNDNSLDMRESEVKTTGFVSGPNGDWYALLKSITMIYFIKFRGSYGFYNMDNGTLPLVFRGHAQGGLVQSTIDQLRSSWAGSNTIISLYPNENRTTFSKNRIINWLDQNRRHAGNIFKNKGPKNIEGLVDLLIRITSVARLGLWRDITRNLTSNKRIIEEKKEAKYFSQIAVAIIDHIFELLEKDNSIDKYSLAEKEFLKKLLLAFKHVFKEKLYVRTSRYYWRKQGKLQGDHILFSESIYPLIESLNGL